MDSLLGRDSNLEPGLAMSEMSLDENPSGPLLSFVNSSGSPEYDFLRTMEADEEMQLQLFNIACNEHMKSNASGSAKDLNRTIALYCFALSKIPDSSELHCRGLFNLSCALEDRFCSNEDLYDLDKAIAVGRGARDLLPTHDNAQLIYLDNLAAQLQTRFDRKEQLEDIEEAIQLRRDVLEVDSLPTERRHVFIRRLARALETRFEAGRDQTDLDEAISLYRTSIGLITSETHADLPLSLRSLADSLMDLYTLTSAEECLDEAISLFRRALSLSDSSLDGKSTSLHNLAHALKMRFDRTGKSEDLDESISRHRQALELFPPRHPNRPMCLINLANAIMARFEQTGQENNLDEAIPMYEEARGPEEATGGPRSSSRDMASNNLASALMYRFDLTGQRSDLDNSIVLHRENLKHLPPNDPRRPEYLTNFANSLNALCRQTGHRGTIDEAILIYRESFELLPVLHPVRSRLVNNFAQTLLLRFEQTGLESDYTEAVALHREALSHHSGSHPNKANSLVNLANTLLASKRSEITENEERRLQEAVDLCREALDIDGHAHHNQSTTLNSLGGALLDLFKCTGREEYLDEAIQRYAEAYNLLQPTNPVKPMYASNLAHVYHCRFKITRHLEDFAEAVALHKKAIELYPSSHYHRYVSFMDLANLLVLAYIRTENDTYLGNAMLFYRSALQSASYSASSIHNIADTWAYHADRLDHPSALEAYDAALRSIFQMASLSLDIYSRQRIIQTARDGLAARAAWFAIRKGHFDKAIEFLEGGRAIFWSQALHLRTSFDRLRDDAPAFAQRLQDLLAELEHASHRSPASSDLAPNNKSRMSLEIHEARFRHLDEEWIKGLSEVRSMPGFEDFLLPRRTEALRAAAVDSPIVFLIPGKDSSDSLIMTAHEIRHVSLSYLTEEKLRSLVSTTKMLYSAEVELSSVPRDEANHSDSINATWNSDSDTQEDPSNDEISRSKGAFGRRRGKPSSNNLFEYVLRTLWIELVKPVVEALNLQRSESPPTVKWCTSGLFSFLPIHAAGCYNSDQGALESTSDYMVSSYTPTAGLLLPPLKETPALSENEPPQMLIVVDPHLPSANIELQKIKTRVPQERLVELGSTGSPNSNVDEICSHLPNASIVHFACHGVQDPSSPLDSSLLAQDGKLSIAKIMKLPIPTGSLAFLCACETAMGDMDVPDEAMSVGACLLFFGYRSVVATMWKIADADGPAVADVFYKELFKTEGRSTLVPDITQSARALHKATLQLRLSGVGYKRWVPFIHMGQ